ncbi:MAG: hypothetical protein HZC24_09635 [Rhodocyclales bacterium]|nr:hypothetical protein [Rhodocyclales bacterium]
MASNDVLAGNAGSDIYLYNLGDGADVISDSGRYFGLPGADGNTLKFGPGITPDMIRVLHEGNRCVLDLGNGDRIDVGMNAFDDQLLHGFDLNANPFTSFAIQTVEFADGTSVGMQDFVMQRGLAKTGTAGEETLVGDDLYHAWIADRLEGGAGNDVLQGGGGSDIYVFNRGDGADRIEDTPYGSVWDATWHEWLANGLNTVVFGAGIGAGGYGRCGLLVGHHVRRPHRWLCGRRHAVRRARRRRAGGRHGQRHSCGWRWRRYLCLQRRRRRGYGERHERRARLGCRRTADLAGSAQHPGFRPRRDGGHDYAAMGRRHVDAGPRQRRQRRRGFVDRRRDSDRPV